MARSLSWQLQKPLRNGDGVCILLALLGGAAVGLLHLIPLAVLGIFLVYVGVQHAAYLRDLLRRWPQL
jgi:hypothetical protein